MDDAEAIEAISVSEAEICAPIRKSKVAFAQGIISEDSAQRHPALRPDRVGGGSGSSSGTGGSGPVR